MNDGPTLTLAAMENLWRDCAAQPARDAEAVRAFRAQFSSEEEMMLAFRAAADCGILLDPLRPAIVSPRKAEEIARRFAELRARAITAPKDGDAEEPR